MVFSHMLLWQVLLAGFVVCMFLAAVFLPLQAWLALWHASRKQKSAYKKLGGQIGLLGGSLSCGLVLLGLILGTVFALNHGRLFDGFFRFGVYAVIGLGLFNLFVGAWLAKTPQSKAAALVSFLGMLLLLVVLTAMLRAVFMPGFVSSGADAPLDVAYALFAPAHDDIVYGLYLLAPFLGLGSAGAVAMLWLLVRRNKDNFGRDYYMLALRWCATWALIGSLALACVAAYAMWLVLLALQPSRYEVIMVFLGASIAVPFVIALVFTLIVRSSNPMRHKLTMLVGLIGLVLFAMYATDLYLALPGALERLQFGDPLFGG